LKWLHIVSSVLLVGTGFGSAYYFFYANRSGSVQAQAVVARLVARADGWFTTPAVIVQPVTGIAMAMLAGWPLAIPWLAVSLALYVIAGACWLPVVWIQIRMARLAQQAADAGAAVPAEYARLARRWTWLGVPAFAAMLVVYALMVFKPTAWPWA
jgi:uncharacterized membrane protein